MTTVTLTCDQLAVLKELFGTNDSGVNSMDDFIGKKLFIRTVTYHSVGKVVRFIDKFIELEGASWVADSGRFMNALKEGTLEEVEPTGRMWVNRDSIVDMFPWNHALPTAQK